MRKIFSITTATIIFVSILAAGIYFFSLKPSTKAELTNISISGLTVSKNGTIWNANVPYSMNSIDIADIISTRSDKSSVTYNGKTSGPISLSAGINTITVIITAKDGKTSNSYTLILMLKEEPETPEPMPEHINVKEWSFTLSQNAVGDGITDDSAAIRSALKKAQDDGVALYFPAGTYNCNNQDLNINTSASGANSRVGKNIYIFGDGANSILESPGTLQCYNDITLRNMSIHKRTGIFIYYLPDEGTYGNVIIKNTKIFGSELGDNCQFFYSSISSLTADKGVNHVKFTNNNANYVRNVLRMCCKVKSGLIDGNFLTNLSTGPSDENLPIRGLAVGNTDSENNWLKATNVTISNNYIKGIFNESRTNFDNNDEEASPDLTYPIIAIGENITIKNNYVEDLNKYTAIYSKATNLRIKGNKLINAGGKSAICVKVGIAPNHGENHSLLASDLVIEDNYISTNVDGSGAIRVHASYYTIRNNTIEQYDNESRDLTRDCYTLSIQTNLTIDGVIEGNNIYSEARNAICFVGGISGKAIIKNNNIHQNIVSDSIFNNSGNGNGAIAFRNVQLSSIIDCTNNNITVERASYGVSCTENCVAGSKINFSNNTVTSYEIGRITSFYYMTSILNNNKFIIKGKSVGLFNFYGPFTFTNNEITFEEDARVTEIITYHVSNQPNLMSDVTSIANNIVTSEIQGVGSAQTVAADYLILISSSTTYSYPQMYLNDNDVTVNNSLILKAAGTIGCVGTININRNKISRLKTSNSAIFDYRDDEKFILGTGADENIVIQL